MGQATTETLTTAQVPTGEFAYEVIFPDGVDPATLPKADVVITNNIHPSIVISKALHLQIRHIKLEHLIYLTIETE